MRNPCTTTRSDQPGTAIGTEEVSGCTHQLAEREEVRGRIRPPPEVGKGRNACMKNPWEEFKKSIDLVDIMWNLSRTENTLINAVNDARESVKMKMKVANELYQK